VADNNVNTRLDRLESVPELDDGGIEKLTIRLRCVETFFENGERRERIVASSYDESAPFGPPRWNTELQRWQCVRVLSPLEEDQQWLRGPSVPKIPTPNAGKGVEGKG